VIFVRDLQRSLDFYQQLFELEVQVAEPEAVLLSGSEGVHIVLRALAGAERVGGGVGVHRLMWTARDRDDLGRARSALEAWGSVSTTSEDGVERVDGLDPDRTPITVIYPDLPRVGGLTLRAHILAY
jgi:catechol 2,3-dioxygenase-like lactoylglutathione lyase family enzyme